MGINWRTVHKKEQIARSHTSAEPGEPGTERLPPGQHLVRPDQFPILDLGVHPAFDPATWSLEVCGEVERRIVWSWPEFERLPQVTVTRDFHCVTTWSKYDVTWTGVSFAWLADQVGVTARAGYVIAHGADLGYTTNIPLADMLRDDVLLACRLEGEPLSVEHGGPVRLVVPHLYGWKSAKWIRRLEFSAVDQPGFWETRGYHNYGDPWEAQRFA